MYCAIIGDLVNSKSMEASERKRVQDTLDKLLVRINNDYKDNIAAKFIITLGDEFQGLLSASWPSVKIIEIIIRNLYPHNVRFGVGISNIYTDIQSERALGADGPAYHLAREAVNIKKKGSKKEETQFAVCYRTGNNDSGLIDVICNSVSMIMGDWTEKQRVVVHKTIEFAGQQNEVARELGINPSTVTRQLKAARYEQYKDFLDAISNYLREQYDFFGEGNELQQASAYQNTGIYLVNNHEYEAAINNFEKAIGIKEKVLGMYDASVASSYCSIGAVYNQKGEYDKAFEMYKKALVIGEKTLNKDHPIIAAIYNNISILYYRKGEYDISLENYYKALDIYEKTLGKTHKKTKMLYNNIVRAYQKQNKFDKAMEYMSLIVDLNDPKEINL